MRVFALIGLFSVMFSGVILAWTLINEALDRIEVWRLNRQFRRPAARPRRDWQIR